MAKTTSHKLDQRHSQRPFFWLLLATAGGIILDRFGGVSVIIWSSAFAITAVSWCVCLAVQRRRAGILMGLISWACLFGIWHHAYWNYLPQDDISRWAETRQHPVAIRGRVVSEAHKIAMPEAIPLSVVDRTEKTYVNFEVESIRQGTEWVACSGSVKLLILGQTDLHHGDRIRVFGNLQQLSSTRNPGEFDFQIYYRGQRIHAWLYCEGHESIRVESRSQWGLNALRSFLRKQLDQQIWSKLSPDNAGLASAILLGNREQMNLSERDQFLLTGTVHVLAISGLHVGILAWIVHQLLKFVWVGRRIRLLTILVFVVAYAWLVEFRAPVTRSMILIVMVCLSRLWGHRGFSLNVLALSALGVLFVNPTELFGVGAQLSFLAVFAMSSVDLWDGPADPLEHLVNSTRSPATRLFNRSRDWLVRVTRMSGMVWLVTLPIVAMSFHTLVPIGLLINPLVVIPMALALMGGLGVMVLGWLWPMGQIGGWLCNRSLDLIQALVEWGSSVPFGHFWVSGPAPWIVMVYYAIFISLAAWRPKFWTGRRLLAGSLIWAGLFWLGPESLRLGSGPEKSLTMTVVDVGHGTSVLLEFPEGERVLVDAGSFGSVEGGQRSISSVLWAKGIEHLDAVFLSHADIDHFNAIPDLCERFSLGRIYVSPNVLEASDPAVLFLKEILQKHQVEVVPVTLGQSFRLKGKAVISVRWPPAFGLVGSDNSQSLVLEVEACHHRVLLPGDIESPGLDALLQSERSLVDVTLAPHHGSLGSRPLEFVDWCRPSVVVVSGMETRINPESLETFALGGAEVLSTAEMGAIQIQMTATSLEWQSWILDNPVSKRNPLVRQNFGSDWHKLHGVDTVERQTEYEPGRRDGG